VCLLASRTTTAVSVALTALLLTFSTVAAAQSAQSSSGQGTATQSARSGQTTTILSTIPGDGLGEYLIGPNDLLSISVMESPDLTRDVRVDSDGTVGLPLLAEHPHIAGLSLTQAEALLKKKYQESGILNDPNITITLKELESKPVTLMGSVRQPGVFQVSGQVRLMRLISMAGGFSEDAGTKVQVIREDEGGTPKVTEVRVEDLRQGRVEANVPVRGGDTVNVLPAGSVYVIGAVNHPGRFLLPSSGEQTSVLNVLALAEDLKRTAKPAHSVLIRKKGPNGEVEQIPVDLSKILARQQPDIPVVANDVLFVPDSTAKRAFARGLEAAVQLSTGIVLLGVVH
jgi:polysaccharide biosynthesis/export protein